MDLKDLLQITTEKNASDLHILNGVPPTIRIDGNLLYLPNQPVLMPEDTSKLVSQAMSAEQLEIYKTNKELDFSYSFSDRARFRVNAYTQKGSWAAAFRKIPMTIPSIDSLHLPKIIHSFTNLRQGLILVTGPTGHG